MKAITINGDVVELGEGTIIRYSPIKKAIQLYSVNFDCQPIEFNTGTAMADDWLLVQFLENFSDFLGFLMTMSIIFSFKYKLIEKKNDESVFYRITKKS